MGPYDVAEDLNQKTNTDFAKNHKPARLDYILMNKSNPSIALQLIPTMYSDHKILKLCMKDIQQQDQRIFRMDDETIRLNQKAIRRILNVSIDLNAADLINGGYVKMKNELTTFLRQASTWRHKMMKRKLQTSDSLQVEQEIAKGLLPTFKVKQTELNEVNLKLVKSIVLTMQTAKTTYCEKYNLWMARY